MAAKPALAAEEVRRILLSLAPLAADRAIVLVGGQAIAVWTNYLGVGETSPVRDPLASKDIDFEGSARAARKAAALLGGSSLIPAIDEHTPNSLDMGTSYASRAPPKLRVVHPASGPSEPSATNALMAASIEEFSNQLTASALAEQRRALNALRARAGTIIAAASIS